VSGPASERRVVLASASPRRREILGTLGLPFRVEIAAIDESVRPGEAAHAYVERVARDKARAVAARSGESELVLAADTSVIVDELILGKPTDDDDARRMLRTLSGRAHDVLTAIAIEGPALDGARRLVSRVVRTEVVFRAIDDGIIDRYVASGEPRDKAGAYAIQGLGMGLVREIRGSYTNVVGLPALETLELLEEAGVALHWPPASGPDEGERSR